MRVKLLVLLRIWRGICTRTGGSDFLNSIYLKTDADVLDNELITVREMSLFKKILGIKSGESLLDIACGQGRHLIELAKDDSYLLSGIDVPDTLSRERKTIVSEKGCL